MATKNNGVEQRVLLSEDITLRADEATGAPVVEGYAAVFNSLSETLFEWNMGRFREKVAPGAFTKTLQESNVPLLIEHADLPLATTRAGTLQLREDDHGLWFSATLDPDDPDVKRIVPKMRRGDLNKMSFAFVPVRAPVDDRQRPRLRTVLEAKLDDISIVHRPAYPATEAKVRKQLADAGFDAECIAELLVRVQQGLELGDEELRTLRQLADVCQLHLKGDVGLWRRVGEQPVGADTGPAPADVTAPEAAPGPEIHPAEGSQPTTTISAPEQPLHPLSWYREQLRVRGV